MDIWIPEIGMLAVRYIIGVNYHEVELGYRDRTNNNWHMRHIARMRDFIAEANFGSYFEGADSQWTAKSTDGQTIIVRRLATDNELAAFAKLWQDELTSFDGWLNQVLDEPNLKREEKDRLVRLSEPTKQRTTPAGAVGRDRLFYENEIDSRNLTGQ